MLGCCRGARLVNRLTGLRVAQGLGLLPCRACARRHPPLVNPSPLTGIALKIASVLVFPRRPGAAQASQGASRRVVFFRSAFGIVAGDRVPRLARRTARGAEIACRRQPDLARLIGTISMAWVFADAAAAARAGDDLLRHTAGDRDPERDLSGEVVRLYAGRQ